MLNLTYALNPDQPLASSEILFNAGREETVDLLIPADQRLSEYERYMQQLAQPMGDVPLEALTEEDISFLSGDTRIERQHISWLAESARAALNINQLDLGQPSRQVMETVFYGWFRDNQPRQFREFIRRSTDLLTSSLENAIQELYIPALSSEIKDQLRRLLDKLRIEEALKPAPERETASLGDMLNILPAHLILDSNQRTAVAKIIDEGLNTEKSLAERLEEAGLHHQQIWGVERIINLQNLSKSHLPLIQALQLDEVDENAASLRDLVSMDTSDWRKLTAMHGTPVSIEGEDEAQRQTLYAEQLAASIENTYPSEWVAHRIQHDRFPVESSAKEGLQTFFQKNPKFQLGKTSAFQYFNNSENIVLEGVSDELMVKEEVFKLERIVRCSPRLEFAAKILENGFGSAQAIASVSRERFKEVTALENPEWTKQADETYARALQANAKAAVIATEYIRAEKGAPIAIMQPRQQPASVNRAIAVSNQTADLHTLFGNLDFCECEHCSSVYSPAAYLVDLLQVLDGGARNGQQESPLDALLKRRPDLVETDFTCENTNTAIPYIDLVLESLENAIEKKGSGAMRVGPRDDAALDRKVLPAKLKDDINSWGISITDKASISLLPQDLNGRKRWLLRDQDWKIHLVGLLNAPAYAVLVWPQTHGSAEALQAVPHYVLPQPYSVLKQSYFPWRLPFDLWWEETRIWLKQLDVERCALMETFAGENRYADFSIAIEYLSFSKSEADQLTVPIGGWSLWGFDSNSDITSSIKDPIGGGSFIPKAPDKTWAGALNQRASLLRHRAGLTQRELMNLLETKFVQGLGQIRLSGDECDAGKMSLAGLDAPALIRIHLFVRLWRKLGWSMPNVDRIIQAFPQAFNSIDSVFNPGFLIFIANVERLRKKTGLPLGGLLNWYTPTLSTQQYANFSRSLARILPSTYEEIFYDRSVAHPKDPAFELNSNRNEVLPANLPETIRRKISLIAAALGVKPNQLEVLLPPVKDGLTLAESDLTDAVNLANLSALSRYTSLAKALHISTKDLLLLIDLTGINPFSNPENTLLLFDRLQFIKIAGCSLADLDYLLRHKSPGQSNLALPESKSAAVLTEIRKILQQIQQETTAGIDERGEITRKWLAYLQWPAELIDEILGPGFLGLESVAADYDANHLPQGIELPDTMRYDRPTRKLMAAGQDKNAVLADLENLIQAAQNTNLVPALKRLENQLQPLLQILIEGSYANSDAKVILTPGGLFKALELLYKAGVLINRLNFSAKQTDWLFDNTWTGLPDFSRLPLQALAGGNQFGEWVNLALIAQTRRKFPEGEITLEKLAGLLNQNSAPTWNDSFQQALADRFNWPEADFKLLKSTEGLNFSGIDGLRSPEKLNQLADCLALILKLGSAAEMAINWKKEELAAQDAAAARQLVRSRYDQAIWYQLAPALQNKLRQKRRAALLDYLIAKANARDANDLFGKYLIDPEMGDCMTTTRILQASSTVQLFLQRCLMGLESEKEIVNGQEIELGVSPAAIDKERWQWMKNYRVWEANRKVFFYPENWIEPELRDDKSLFFQELESELLQGDITSEKAESALRNYLTKLDEVSRLEVVGMYRDTPKASDGRLKYGFETLHVFGRTYTDPRKYFFRTYQKLGFAPAEGNWTAWQRVDLDFEGANLLYPIVWQQKIYLFWLSFIEKAEEKISEKGTLPNKFWEFRLNWSVFENEKWQVKKVFPIDGLKIPISNTVLKSSFVLKGQKKLDNFRFGLIGPVPVIDDAFVTRKLSQINFDGYSVNKLNDLLFANIIGSVKGPEILISEDSIISLDGLGMIFDNSGSQRRIIKPHQDIEQRNEFRAPSLLNSNSEKEVFNLNGSAAHFVISDSQKSSFLGYPYWETLEFEGRKYDLAKILFFTLYHPQTARFQRSLLESGLKSMLQLENQNDAQATKVFDDLKPRLETISQVNRPNLNVDFSSNGAYSQYNWELFFHLPFIVAAHLAKNQRFEEARQWFHYIFDPTDDSQEPEPARFWRFRPFHENARTTPIQQLAKILTTEDALLTQEERQEKQNFDLQVRQWLANPFKPHAVARWRNRAYMFSVVMKYLDNLIAWGDQLFRRDTRESLNEALQIYMLAAQILGRKPESIPRRTRPITQSFSDVKGKLDKLSNILVAAENVLGPSDSPGQVNTPLAAMPSLLFCVPENPKILEYHDKVADRLFKLRNCMNIDGVKRQLALFDPPIDPAILVKAAAAGIDISTVLNDLNAPTPLYRFNIMVQKATELCSEVKNLGGLLLASLEKRDAEELSLIRSQHEIRLLEQQRQIKELQREETKASSNALSESLKAAEAKQKYYSDLLSAIEEMEDFSIPNGPVGQLVDLIRIAIKDTGIPAEIVGKVENFIGNIKSDGKKILNETLTSEKTPMIPVEKRQLEELKLSHDLQERAKAYQNVAQMTSMLPDVTIGIQGVSSSPVIQAQIGGSLLSKIAQLQGSFIEYESSEHAYRANLHSILAGYQRRATDWKYQENLAKLEYDQISEQIAAAALRETIVNKELLLIEKQIENAQLVEDFMRNKYANQELYDWMAGQISNTYFQSYQLAYDMAKRAEKAYRFELGLQDSDSNFIQFGYWDNLKKGLLAGEKLHHDLKRMELAYLDQNRREYELTKHISLRQLNPAALLFFRATGLCEFEIPEWLYDLDCPGHYMRRIKSVSLSIPCVAGPYTGINCALSLQKSALRISPTNPDEYGRTGGEDGRFKNYYGAIQSIVASNAQNDSGLFELNFRDERFLPFEGAGAISSWKLELPGELRQFDYQTIADVILHIRYTSRPGGEALKTESVKHFKTLLKPDSDTKDKTDLIALFSLKHDFPNEWNKALTQKSSFSVQLKKEHFPYFAQPFNVQLKKAARWKIKENSPQELDSFIGGTISDQNKEFELSVKNLGNAENDVFLLLNYTLSET